MGHHGHPPAGKVVRATDIRGGVANENGHRKGFHRMAEREPRLASRGDAQVGNQIRPAAAQGVEGLLPGVDGQIGDLEASNGGHRLDDIDGEAGGPAVGIGLVLRGEVFQDHCREGRGRRSGPGKKADSDQYPRGHQRRGFT